MKTTKNKIVILNGAGINDSYLDAPFSLLLEAVKQDYADSEVIIHNLRDYKLAHCTGCFGCFIKTPGKCSSSDEGKEIIKSVIQSDVTILFTPVTFGGYSSILKIIIERFIVLILPFFKKYGDEIHHEPRYAKYPRLISIGVQQQYKSTEAGIFKTLAGRNAINFNASSYAAEVINAQDNNETIIAKIKDVFTRIDVFPLMDEAMKYLPKTETVNFNIKPDGSHKVLLLIGSPRVTHRSSSSLFGEYLTRQMDYYGWVPEVITLKRNIDRENGQADLCAAVDRNDIIIFAFPLYADSLPYMATKALEIIAGHKNSLTDKKPQAIYTIVNCGFPEYEQNALALAICNSFAVQSGITWAGGLAIGAGEAFGNGIPLTEPKRKGLSVNALIEGLDIAAKDLAECRTVSKIVQDKIIKIPIPGVSFSVWRWIFKKVGSHGWIEQAKKNGVNKAQLYAKPYEV
ncbi:MAG: NAD(P)H-dependent oxidoreductase [bacterium]